MTLLRQFTLLSAFYSLFQFSSFLSAESFNPLRTNFSSSSLIASKTDDFIKESHKTKVKRFGTLTLPIANTLHPVYYNNLIPLWEAAANILSDNPESSIQGTIKFQPWPLNNYVKVEINVTDLPSGKHALHIHTFGDVHEGCNSTGGQFPNTFIGNIDTNDDGSISTAFLSPYLRLFGFNGIIGRSIVIHSKPIDLNLLLNAEVISSPLQPEGERIGYGYSNEEESVGQIIACGIITITRKNY